jgi:16S rRNA (uracil1498-N3)-methyltransferase
MSLPYFFHDSGFEANMMITLSEDTSKHVVQVLRIKEGEGLKLTNGKGFIALAVISNPHKKNCTIRVESVEFTPNSNRNTCVAISPVKNNSRFEWFLEKATEMGVTTIIPLICNRTEKQHFRKDRMNAILISAMLQSQQAWIPEMLDPKSVHQLIQEVRYDHQYVAHCKDDAGKIKIPVSNVEGSMLVAIGPEGDFTEDEIDAFMDSGFVPVTLGDRRLRTETAGVFAAAIMNY